MLKRKKTQQSRKFEFDKSDPILAGKTGDVLNNIISAPGSRTALLNEQQVTQRQTRS